MSEGPDSRQQRAAAAAFDDATAEVDPGDLPEVDFATFVLSLSHSARMHLGDAPNPVDGQTVVELSLARQTIDLLALLQDKTQGNLSGEEDRLLSSALFDLRMRYVEVRKAQ